MLEYAILLGGSVAVLVAAFRLIRRRPIHLQDRTSFNPFTTVFRDPSSGDSEEYVPDTGELTWQILKAMRRLGHASITHSARALAPHLHVEGAAADINAIVDFQDAILADVQAFVAANGKRYRWTLTEKPTLTHSVAPDGTPGVLRITRARPPRSPFTAGNGDVRNAATLGGTANVRSPQRPVNTGRTPTAPIGEERPFQATRDLRVVRTRRLGADGAGATSPTASTVRLFRVGGGNIYQLRPGVNVAGRDPTRCDIVLGFDDAVSAVHAEFVMLDQDAVTVRDLGSSNGTLLADSPVTGEAVRLSHGDVLTIGTTRLRLVNGDAPLVPTAKLAGDG